jgi:hypothetical protein
MYNERIPRIAIVDTGIEKNVSYNDDIIGNITFSIENEKIYMMTECYDRVGHGTQVASCIKQRCSPAKLFIVNIYKDDVITSSVLLLEALRYLLTIDVDIINISLAVNSEDNNDAINQILKELYSQGKIIVSSVKNGQTSSFPAESPYCIGVLGLKTVAFDHFWVHPNNKIQIFTSKLPEQVETLQGKETFFCGNSKAAATTTACIANIMIERRTYGMGMNAIFETLKIIKEK